MVFHEITPEAIAPAVAHPREMDDGLVEAYQTRRVLDRLYGYEVSPVLWKKVMPQLSAGRVQSVAVRLVVDRERERIAFRPARYWDLEAVFAKIAGNQPGQPPTCRRSRPRWSSVDGRRVAQGRDFSSIGLLKSEEDVLHLDGAAAAGLADRLGDASFAVSSVERKPYRRSPYAPFRTTTLQQEASRKLGFSSKYTMSVAQRLYENGHITYMRTDSITLSQTAITAARAQARELYGADYVPDAPRVYTSKVKSAQEAHEAIRPAGDEFQTPAQAGLSGDELRLYELVWKRTVASQMKDATGESVSVRVAGRSSTGENAEFGASGKIISFYGFLKAYVEGSDDPDAELDDRERRLPPLAEPEPLTAVHLAAAEHATRPPARYTEASLIKELEDRDDRPPVDLRLDHRDHPGSRLRVQEGDRAGPVVRRVRRDHAARAALRAPGRLRLHRADGRGARRDRQGRGRPGALAAPVLLRRRRRGRAQGAGQRPERHRRPGGQLVPARGHRHRGPGRPVRAVPGAGRAAGQHPRGHRAGRADPGVRRASCCPGRAATRSSAPTRRPGTRWWPRRAGSART